MARKRLLILTYYWPPAGGAGVQRWLKFVKYLAEFDYEIHVYAAENPEAPALDTSLLSDIPEHVQVIKKPIREPFSYYKSFTNKKGNFNAGFLSEEQTSNKSISVKIALFIRANFFIPDAKMFWISPSVHFLKKYIHHHQIDLIISSGPPHSLHLIALKLQKKTGIKWIADFRDPWTNIDFYQELPMLSIANFYHKYLEKKVLKRADKIVVVGETMKKEFQKTSQRDDIEVITNGYDAIPKASDYLDKEFTIVHIGSINTHRSHESFYKALHILRANNAEFAAHLRLKFIGKTDFKARSYISQYELENCTQFIDYMPYSMIGEIQSKARLLYLPINNSQNASGILTGKFFEYLAALRPILAQGPENGDIATILKETQAGAIVGFNDMEKMQKTILEFYEGFLRGVDKPETTEIGQFSRKSLTNRLHQIIQSI
jgi:glycosyltransferase involved in cell wall biosynthesis